MIKTFTLSILTVLISLHAYAKVELPRLLANNTVLQQNSHTKLWGKGISGSTISITATWSAETLYTTVDETGNWITEIATPSAGGPFSITFDDGVKTTISNIMIGEVWLCSGQSNMFMKLKGNPTSGIYILNADEIVANADNENLRLFTVLGTLSETPSDVFSGNWRVSSPEHANNFSGVAFQFGQMLQKALNIPVGIIVSGWSGSFIRAWIGNEYLSEFPEMLVDNSETLNGQSPTALYNSMIYPLRYHKMRGALWYQGESDVVNYPIYERMLQIMVSNWRETLYVSSGEFPFYLTQLHPWHIQSDQTDRNGAYLRESQIKASSSIPNANFIVALDCGEEFNIHPPDKTTIAQRFVNLALADTYQMDNIDYQFPELQSYATENNTMLLEFNHVGNGLIQHDSLHYGFELAGKNKLYYPASQAIVKDKKYIKILSESVRSPMFVRYAFKNFSHAYVFNSAGLPAPSFRTDTFPNIVLDAQALKGAITAWNFDDQSLDPVFGEGKLQVIGGVEMSMTTGIAPGLSTVDAGVPPVNSGQSLVLRQFPQQGTNPKTAGFEFSVSTEGYKDIKVLFDVRHNQSSANSLVLQCAYDGINFTDVKRFDNAVVENNWYLRSCDLTDVALANDNPKLKFRIVTGFDGDRYMATNISKNYNLNSDMRFDNIKVMGDEQELLSGLSFKQKEKMKLINNTISFDSMPISKIRLYDLSGNIIQIYEPQKNINLSVDRGIYIIRYDETVQKLFL